MRKAHISRDRENGIPSLDRREFIIAGRALAAERSNSCINLPCLAARPEALDCAHPGNHEPSAFG
jgi:hypothetical protein